MGKSQAYPITNYRQLVEQVAYLSYLNEDHLLFFRGQTQDYINKAGESTFYPSIYREENIRRQEIKHRFEILEYASHRLVELFREHKMEGHNDVKRKPYIQWSILQHCGVCHTPLLDLTHSLRVACSFAQQDSKKDIAFVYVFGLPYITNRITINSEHDIVNIRLISICPPLALRPHFQEAYLAGTTDITHDYSSKSELDFRFRLIAKFSIPNNPSFWGSGLSKIPESILYPKNDRVEKLCHGVEARLRANLLPGDMGIFLTEWTELEQSLIKRAKAQVSRPLSTRESIRLLFENRSLDESHAYRLDELRKFRNILVHEPKLIEPGSLHDHLQRLRELVMDLPWAK